MLGDLSRLRSFIAVAEELSFTRAAERLHIAQPSLSRSIRRLEQDVGVGLFARTSRSVALTPAGEALLEHARAAVAHADRGMSAARRAANGAGQTLRVAFTSTLATRFLPLTASRFAEANPTASLTLSEAAQGVVCDGLVSGEFDVGVLYSANGRGREVDGFVVETLSTDRLYAVVPADHALARRASVPLDALAREPWIAMARSTSADAHELLLELGRRAGRALSVVQEATTIHLILGLVAARIGVSALPAAAASRLDGVAFVPLDDAFELDLLAVVAGEANALARAFLDAAHDTAGESELGPATRA
jgi:DNA-binding transcriptional LysR family regulator